MITLLYLGIFLAFYQLHTGSESPKPESPTKAASVMDRLSVQQDLADSSLSIDEALPKTPVLTPLNTDSGAQSGHLSVLSGQGRAETRNSSGKLTPRKVSVIWMLNTGSVT